MLEREDQRAIGRELRAIYAYMPDPMMPDRLNGLVARLLEMEAQFPAAQGHRSAAQRGFGDWSLEQNEDRQLS